jgi:hypothetical protein
MDMGGLIFLMPLVFSGVLEFFDKVVSKALYFSREPWKLKTYNSC